MLTRYCLSSNEFHELKFATVMPDGGLGCMHGTPVANHLNGRRAQSARPEHKVIGTKTDSSTCLHQLPGKNRQEKEARAILICGCIAAEKKHLYLCL